MSRSPVRAPRSWKGLVVFAAGSLMAGSIGALRVVTLSAQAPSPAPASSPAASARFETFERASITPSRAVGTTRINMAAGGRFEATNASVRQLIRFAYQMQDFQIAGGPRWIDSDRFDIVATRSSDPAAAGGGEPRLRTRLRALLADRFKLKVGRETRDLPLYELVMARRDGKLGEQLRPSKLDCAALTRAFAAAGPTPGTPPPVELTRCGVRMSPGTLTAGGVTLSELAAALSRLTGRSVENKTGLTGVFDLQLDYFHELTPPTTRPAVEPVAADRPPDIEPSMFVSIQEQLGLRLDPRRGPVDVLLISTVERPSAD